MTQGSWCRVVSRVGLKIALTLMAGADEAEESTTVPMVTA